MNNLLQILIGSATIGGIVVWLGKLIINKGFDAALKTFENKLELLKIEHQIKFSKLHEERAVQLKQLYTMLYELEKSLKHYTDSFQGSEWTEDNERKKAAIDKLLACEDSLETNRIFFPEEFCNKLEENIDKCREVVLEMEKAKIRERRHNTNQERGIETKYKDGEWPLDIWFKQEEIVKNDINRRRIELANNFRELFGVEKTTEPNKG
ncbi:MAG: hypothetical protein LPK79_07485 [Bacteroidota bacterium]|nr:hypothetical protein [Bacteroidota bacterium]MDX5449147.1 hypothetical protein [Bacteroidota bacterium]